MDLALKGEEWRKPGLVALAAELARSAGEHRPINVRVPASYVPKTGANPWAEAGDAARTEPRAVPQCTWTRESRLVSAGAAEELMAPPPKPASLAHLAASSNDVELTAMSTVTPAPAPPTSVVLTPQSAVPLPRSRPSQERRLSEDVLDERRLFGARGSRDAPPTHRVSRQSYDDSGRLSSTSSCRSSGRVVGRARGDSLAEDSLACWLPVRPSSSAPGSLNQGADASNQEAAPAGLRA
jgi:hypothetical protein